MPSNSINRGHIKLFFKNQEIHNAYQYRVFKHFEDVRTLHLASKIREKEIYVQNGRSNFILSYDNIKNQNLISNDSIDIIERAMSNQTTVWLDIYALVSQEMKTTHSWNTMSTEEKQRTLDKTTENVISHIAATTFVASDRKSLVDLGFHELLCENKISQDDFRNFSAALHDNDTNFLKFQ